MIEADFFDKVISIIISSYISKEMKYHSIYLLEMVISN